jgi:prophage regulatory protein
MNMKTTRAVELDRVIRLKEVVAVTGLSATTIWRREQAGDFPRRRKISPGAVGWLASEVQAWLNGRECADGRSLPGKRR